VQEVVADEEANVVGQVVAELDADLGDEAEPRLRMMTDVARQGVEAADEGLHAAIGRGDALAAVDSDGLLRDADAELEVAFEGPAAGLPFGAGADLAAVEAVARVEAIEDREDIAGTNDTVGRIEG